MFVFIPLPHGGDDSVVQSTDGVCSSTFGHPFRLLGIPEEEYRKIVMAQRRSALLMPDPAQLLPVAKRTVPHRSVETP